MDRNQPGSRLGCCCQQVKFPLFGSIIHRGLYRFIGSFDVEAGRFLVHVTYSPWPNQRNAGNIRVNGKNIAFEAYNINNNNYFKLRDLAKAVNGTDKSFEVSWDSANNAISLEPGKAYTTSGGELTVAAKLTKKQAKTTENFHRRR
jgi:hypothetical protein